MDKLDDYIKSKIMSYLKVNEFYQYIKTSKSELKLEQQSHINNILLYFFKENLYSYKKHFLTINNQLKITENDFNNLKRYYMQSYTLQ